MRTKTLINVDKMIWALQQAKNAGKTHMYMTADTETESFSLTYVDNHGVHAYHATTEVSEVKAP